jgi:geranylgeranyl diphosphate synthase type II
LATIHPVRTGALIGTGGAIDADRFIRFGFLLGAAFQIQDDLLNLVGDEIQYGKELSGDLAEGKRTLMLIRLFERLPPAQNEHLRALLLRPRAERTLEDLQWVRAEMDRYDCIEYARRVAHALAGAAQHELDVLIAALPDSRDKRFLAALPTWVIERA